MSQLVCQICFLEGTEWQNCLLIKILFQYTRYMIFFYINPEMLNSAFFSYVKLPSHVVSTRLLNKQGKLKSKKKKKYYPGFREKIIYMYGHI